MKRYQLNYRTPLRCRSLMIFRWVFPIIRPNQMMHVIGILFLKRPILFDEQKEACLNNRFKTWVGQFLSTGWTWIVKNEERTGVSAPPVPTQRYTCSTYFNLSICHKQKHPKSLEHIHMICASVKCPLTNLSLIKPVNLIIYIYLFIIKTNSHKW